MKLTLLNRLKLCFEIITIRSGHKHTAQEKILSTFQSGYKCGYQDGYYNARLDIKSADIIRDIIEHAYSN